MNLSEMIVENAAWMLRSGVEVTVNTAYGTVAIGDVCFLQGEEADNFIESARGLYYTLGDVALEDCYDHLAKPYIECLG